MLEDEALEGELKYARTKLSKTEADLNEARTRVRTTIADFKNSPAFENFIEAKRQQWISDFHISTGVQVEMQQSYSRGRKQGIWEA